MADDFQSNDATGTPQWIRASERNDGGGLRKIIHNIMRGYLSQGDSASGEPPVIIGGIRRANVASLEGADGTAFQLIGDGDGRLRVNLEGTTSLVQPATSGFAVQAAQQHGVVYTSAGVALTVGYFSAEVAGGSTAQQIVAAVSGKRIYVTSLSETVGAAQTTVTWVSKPTSGATSNVSKHAWDAYGGRILDFSEHGHFRTVSGEALTLTTVGDVTYIEGTYVAV